MMPKIKQSIIVSQHRSLEEQRERGTFLFQIVKAMNFVDFPVGEYLDRKQIERLIQEKVYVTITLQGKI